MFRPNMNYKLKMKMQLKQHKLAYQAISREMGQKYKLAQIEWEQG